MAKDSPEIQKAARQAIIDAVNASASADRADVVNDPSWAVRFDSAWEEGWKRNVASDWDAAFEDPAGVEPQRAVPDGFVLGKIRDLVNTATCLATLSPPATTPISPVHGLKRPEFKVTDLVEAGQKAAEQAAQTLLRRRH